MPSRKQKKNTKKQKKKQHFVPKPARQRASPSERQQTPLEILDRQERDYFVRKIGFSEQAPLSDVQSIKHIYRILAPHFGLKYTIMHNEQPVDEQLVSDLRSKINGNYTNEMAEPYYPLMSQRLKRLTRKYGNGAFHFFYKNPTDFIQQKRYAMKSSYMWYHLTTTKQADKDWLFDDDGYFIWLPRTVMEQWGLADTLNMYFTAGSTGSIHYIVSQVIFTDWPFNRNMVIELGPYIHPTLDGKTCSALRTFFENDKWSKTQFERKFGSIVEMMKWDKSNSLLIWIARNVMDGDGYYLNTLTTQNEDVPDVWQKFEKQGKKMCHTLFSKRLLRFVKHASVEESTLRDIQRIIGICDTNQVLWRLMGLIIDEHIRSDTYRKMPDIEKFLAIFDEVSYFPELDRVFQQIAVIIGFAEYTKILSYPTATVHRKAMKLQQRIIGVVCGSKRCNKKQTESAQKFKLCDQCQCTWYCCRTCQRADWKEHRYVCC